MANDDESGNVEPGQNASFLWQLDGSASDVWDLLLVRSVRYEYPLGEASRLSADPGSAVRFTRHSYDLHGEVAAIEPLVYIEVNVGGTSQSLAPGRTLALETRPRDDGTELELRLSGFDEDDAAMCHHFIESTVSVLRQLLRDVGKRRDRVRQAVVLIHGVGEQEPGASIEQLVTSGALTGEETVDGDGAFLKPDRGGPLLDVPRWVVKQDFRKGRPTTDVYELYWAHQMSDTTTGHIAAWLRTLIVRSPRLLPKRFLPLWILSWVLLLGVVVVAFLELFTDLDLARRYAAATGAIAVLAAIWRFGARGVLIGFAGDAARYLSARPTDQARREEIRRDGIALLDRLHHAGYDRIVVVGHSLGTVIAYDLIRHYWTMASEPLPDSQEISIDGVKALERRMAADWTDFKLGPDGDAGDTVSQVNKAARELPDDDRDVRARQVQKLQRAAWQDCRVNGVPWLITDLVTVGSPLAHADFLLGGRRTFAESIRRRVYPACPPFPEINKVKHVKVSYQREYEGLFRKRRDHWQLHHAAPFAVTRWTNVHYRALNDPIGGPVAPKFGHWVRDIELTERRGFAHTKYWDDIKHSQALRYGLHLNERKALRHLAKRLRPSQLL